MLKKDFHAYRHLLGSKKIEIFNFECGFRIFGNSEHFKKCESV